MIHGLATRPIRFTNLIEDLRGSRPRLSTFYGHMLFVVIEMPVIQCTPSCCTTAHASKVQSDDAFSGGAVQSDDVEPLRGLSLLTSMTPAFSRA